MRCPPSRIKLWTFHVENEVRYRDPIARSGQLGLRENQLDHSSAGMCYRTHIMGAWIEIIKFFIYTRERFVAPYTVRGLKYPS